MTVMYKILKGLEKSMSIAEFDPEMIGFQTLGVDRNMWGKCLKILAKEGYVDGIEVKEYITGDFAVNIGNAEITMRGLEFLSENNTMRRIANAMKGIKDAVPFV